LKTKITFEFLEEETERKNIILQAESFFHTIQDFDDFLRGKLKYEELTEDENKAYREIREKLYELLNENDLKLHI
jgi:hypothetical protein